MAIIQSLKREGKRYLESAANFGYLYSLRYNYYWLRWYHHRKDGEKYIDTVYAYLKDFLSSHINSFRNENSAESEPESKNIWVSWWQGYGSMPELCKMCFENLKRNVPSDYTLTMITKDNYDQYVQLPSFIFDRIDAGELTLTQFSDILREALLYQQGGFWIDLSVWTTPNFLEFVDHEKEFWSIKLNEIDRQCIGEVISKCLWSGFYMYAKKGNVVTKFAFKSMCAYYKHHTKTIDYFIQNMIIRIGYDHVPCIRKAIDAYSVSNEELYTLYVVMDKPFDQQLWTKFTSKTGAFKLTQKRSYAEFVDGKQTFYGFIKEYNNKQK